MHPFWLVLLDKRRAYALVGCMNMLSGSGFLTWGPGTVVPSTLFTHTRRL